MGLPASDYFCERRVFAKRGGETSKRATRTRFAGSGFGASDECHTRYLSSYMQDWDAPAAFQELFQNW